MQKAEFPFHIIVKPIGSVCNLQCTYCYYLEKRNLYPGTKSFQMSDEVLENLTRQYIECHSETGCEVHFNWQGGEPTLLGIPFFQKAVELQQRHKPTHMKITNTLQTNGVLLNNEWARFLHDKDFLVGISIDGPERFHDRYRKDKNQKGSFQFARRGLEILQKYNVKFNVLTVVNNINGNHPEETYTFLKEIGAKFIQFIPIIERANNGKMRVESVGSRQWGKFLQRVFDCWLEDVGNIFVQLFDGFLGLYLGFPSSLCIHAKTCGRAAAVEHNGDVYSCDHFVFREYLLGNIGDKNVAELLGEDFQKNFGEEKARISGHCLRCRYLAMCHGGCPAHRFAKPKGGGLLLNYLCEGFKLFFSHSLPYFRAMAECLSMGRSAQDYQMFYSRSS